jgi:hypothetical protein
MKTLLPVLLIAALASCSTAKKDLLGYWYKPKTMENIRFHQNNTFEYNEYDSASNKTQLFTGTYKLDRPAVILTFPNKTTQTLTFDRAIEGNKSYYLKKADAYFIKDTRVNNAVPPDSATAK